MKLVVTIEETLSRDIEVDAINPMDATEKVREMYDNGEIILSADDFVGAGFYINEKESN